MNIQFLKEKGGLSQYEKLKLQRLKLRHALENGYTLESDSENEEVTVSSENHSKDHAPNIEKNEEILENQETPEMGGNTDSRELQHKESTTRKDKQGFPSAFILFKRKKLLEVNQDNKVEVDFGVEEWHNMTKEDKQAYVEEAALEKEKLGTDFRKDIKQKAKSLAEKKESRKLVNKRYKTLMKEANKKRDENNAVCVERYKEILQRKRDKLERMKAKTEKMTLEVSGMKIENSILKKLYDEKDSLNNSVKEKYHTLFKTHRSCKRKM